MLSIRESSASLCDGVSRREVFRAGGLAALGLSLPTLNRIQASSPTSAKRAKNCIVLFLLGGPPQHSTWDPKPDALETIRGEFGPIATNVPGVNICSLFPKLAQQAAKVCFVRAMSTGDNAHSSSGYSMLTGVPHAPMNAENVNPGPPNDWPTLASLVRRIAGDKHGMPGAVRLPMHIFNTDNSVWPGQDAGFLGRASDPWLFRCEPASPQFRIPEFTLMADVPLGRLSDRRDLLQRFDRSLASTTAGPVGQYDRHTTQAFDLLGSPQARMAYDLNRESVGVRDRYGRHHFGQSCLLARRLIEAGVSLVQVNWFRGPDEPSDAPCWDTHAQENARLKTVLAPTLDQSFSALVNDLDERGMLDETLVVCMSEFGRTPRFNGRGGRDHWGHVFSVALAGGGILGGQAYGASDAIGAYPKEGKVTPQDLTATILHALGIDPASEIRDAQGRPLPASRGDVVTGLI